ncbi:MAG: hypothetical protein FJ030_10580 [Chloroflexi bacterium]|nr:hypothetical protein [Chloroflexota bacterium]
MSTEYDPKGKVFTHVVHKDVVHARIQTITHQIVGEIYLTHEKRIKDELEFAEKFIAITAPKVFNLDGTLAYEAVFITINRDHIVWLALEDEPRS